MRGVVRYLRGTPRGRADGSRAKPLRLGHRQAVPRARVRAAAKRIQPGCTRSARCTVDEALARLGYRYLDDAKPFCDHKEDCWQVVPVRFLMDNVMTFWEHEVEV